MMPKSIDSRLVPAEFPRPEHGPCWKPGEAVSLPLSGLPAWQSNGGPQRGHPARSFPFSLEIRIPDSVARVNRIDLVGVFALHADSSCETAGTLGATLQLLGPDHEPAARYDLINGRHYSDASCLTPKTRSLGDGTRIETLGCGQLREQRVRVDCLSIDIPPQSRPRRLLFRDLGSPASFVVFDVLVAGESQAEAAEDPSGIPYGELMTAVRIRDRLKFAQFVQQVEAAIDEAEDLDEARDQGLTFLSVLMAAVLEGDARRYLPRFPLETAREMELTSSRPNLKHLVRRKIEDLSGGLLTSSESATDRLMDRALGLIERHFAKELTDSMVASQLGLSTSHFRYLFKQATGSPFHKYVVALRLEKARQMLLEQDVPVSQVASAVGFTGLSHFSRAFTQRFSASPSSIRRAVG